ncbi:hypothetical protein CEXT_607481 [Caerostris extrusa]|uniref:Uncharacterized protein n=1 Tax=Caerostris extrusa TaxID=172846 RepID=A0AAV4N7V9_CAEEX|nr:hypothetical protein CEXT_607481 [Caerostris extrusa]
MCSKEDVDYWSVKELHSRLVPLVSLKRECRSERFCAFDAWSNSAAELKIFPMMPKVRDLVIIALFHINNGGLGNTYPRKRKYLYRK